MEDIVHRLRHQAPIYGGLTQDLREDGAKEIERLRSDLALLGPVTTPTHGIVCGSCIQDVSPNWTYCPYCGSQERNSATGERIRPG